MKKKSFNTRLYLMYFIALAPLIAFGIYKNCISLHNRGFTGFMVLSKPVILLLCSLIGAMGGGILRELGLGTKFDRGMIDKLKCDIVEALLFASLLPIDANALAVASITFVFSLFLSKLSLNRVALMYLIMFGINAILGLNDFRNVYEASTALNYDGFDLFFGNGVGGIFSTNVLLITLGFAFLCINKLYKKEMVTASLITFLILGIVPKMVMGQYTEIFNYIFGYNILFILVFVGPNLYSSSYTVKGQISSGILIGLLTCLLSIWVPYMAACLAVLIASFSKGILDRVFVIK